MSKIDSITDTNRFMERLARNSQDNQREISIVTSPGARAAGWAVKVKSLSSYNVYNVRVVEIGEPGSLPVECGDTMQAVNLAESFIQTGTLSAGTFVAMLKLGEKNVFDAPV